MCDKEPALALKSEIRRREREVALQSVGGFNTKSIIGISYDAVTPGKFVNLDKIRLSWVSADYFMFHWDQQTPFQFVRYNQEVVEPENMYTDGGSIPRQLWTIKGLSPWSFTPAFLLHDWEFEAHHCGRIGKSFEDVRDTMLEAVKTLMESGLCEKSPLIFSALFEGIDSFIARRLWSRNPPACTLP